MKSRISFIHDSDELIESPSTRRIQLCYNHLQYVCYKLMQTPSESLASGASDRHMVRMEMTQQTSYKDGSQQKTTWKV